MKTCDPKGRDCIEGNASQSFNCPVACEGVYADVQMEEGSLVDEIGRQNLGRTQIQERTGNRGVEMDLNKFNWMLNKYRKIKRNYVRHFRFNSTASEVLFGKSKNTIFTSKHYFFPNLVKGEELDASTFELIQIFFATSTFDDIELDKKVKLEAQISLIGGTMGLFTGFSIISGVEICYFVTRVLFRILISKLEWLLSRFENERK